MPISRHFIIISYMYSPEVLLKEYTIILSGESTESIRQAENTLLQLQKDQQFHGNNGMIICSNQVAFPIRKLATIYLINYSKRINKSKFPGLPHSALQFYLKLLQNQMMPFQLKTFIVTAIEIIINCELHRALRLSLNQEYIKLVRKSMQQEDNEINFTYFLFLGQSLLGKDNYIDQVRQVVKTTIQFSFKLSLRLFHLSKGMMLVNRQQYLMTLKLIKENSILLKLYMKRIMLLETQCIRILYLPQLQELITFSFQFTVKQNQITSFIFTSIQNEPEISKLINNIKANYIHILNSTLRVLITHTRHPSLLASNKLYSKSSQFLELIINETSTLLKNIPYYQMPTKIMLLQSLYEILNLLANLIKINDFYIIFINHKNIIIQNILFPSLQLSPTDYIDFFQNGLEFVQHTIQMVDRNLSLTGGENEVDDQIKQYTTLKTFAAELLNMLCKFQDGTLSHIFDYSFNLLQSKQPGTASRSLMLLVSAILLHQIKQRTDINQKLFSILMQILEVLPSPSQNKENKEFHIEYAYALLILSKLFYVIVNKNPNLVDKIYKIGLRVIQSTVTHDAQKHFAFELFNNISKLQIGKPMAASTIFLYNHLLKSMDTPSYILLDSYFMILQYNLTDFRQSTPLIIEGLSIISMHIDRQAQKDVPTKILMNKCWNIIRTIGENNIFIPDLIPNIEEIILPLLKYVDGLKSLDFDEDIIMLLTYFLQKGKKVTENQQKMFEIIPKIFYNQNSCRFGQSYHAIQLFIFYGDQILKNNRIAIDTIITMGLSSMKTKQYLKKNINQNENCQGVLILQSLILKCGAVFTLQIWISIVHTVLGVLQEPNKKQAFFTSNLYSLLTLVLVHSHSFFSNQENELLLSKILQKIKVYTNVQYAPKVIIAGLTQLLQIRQKQFVIKRYTQLLDIIITLLEITSLKKDTMFDVDEETPEEKTYSKSVMLTKNDLKDMDEFKYFKEKINKIKHYEIFRSSVNELPKTKRQFFSHILRIQRVLNEPRQIYKIKRQLP